MLEQCELFPNDIHKDIHLYIMHDVSVDNWIKERHYLQCVPAGAIIRMCFKDSGHRVVGCMLWGHPIGRKLDQTGIMELTRMCFIDDTPHCVESKCLSMARKYIRKHHSSIKGLIAYSSSSVGHEGTVYKADNWYVLGVTKSAGASWETRPGRVNRDLSNKMRWTRSP